MESGQPDAFTLVIEGGWGRGKTTLMRQIERQFRESREAEPIASRRQVDSIWLNAWKYPDEEKIQAGLLGQLIDRFRSGSMLEQLVIRVDEHKERLARAILRVAAPWFFRREDEEGGRYDPVFERRAFLDTFDSLFQQLVYLRRHGAAAVRDLESPDLGPKLKAEEKEFALAVFLDDLDRCSNERVIEVLEAIYGFQDMPGVCFYVGIDRPRLVAALVAQGRDEAFLEKIVQLSYQIPPVSGEGAGEFIDGLLKRCGLDAALGTKDGGHLRNLATSLETHPRHLKRFLNVLSLRLGVLRNTGLLVGAPAQKAGAVALREVLAVHALGWLLEGKDLENLRSVQELRDFLERFDAVESRERPDHISEGAFALFRAQRWIFDALREIAADNAKLVTLVNLGSPAPPGLVEPDEPVPATTRPRFGDREIEWVELPGGLFVMGDRTLSGASPEHSVTVSPFSISKYSVTNEQYQRYLEENEAVPAPEHWEGREAPDELLLHPVTFVSWDDAKGYCEWLQKRLRERRAGQTATVDLPTEARWEYAARGGDKQRPYPWGEAEPNPDLANCDDDVGSTTPVDRYRRGATPEGVWDLAGNVWEWCRDGYGPYPSGPVTDPVGPSEAERRVLRGGSFSVEASVLRASFRNVDLPVFRYRSIGFRVVLSVPGGQS